MAEKWYKNSYLRLLTDMHIPDWNEEFMSKFDPEKYVEDMSSTGIDTVYLYANSCVGICNWPTKLGHMHNGHKGQDRIKALTEGFAAKGINVIVYINMWSKYIYDMHPDWRCKDPYGRGSAEYMFGQPGRYGVLCPNSPYRDYVLGLVDELCSSYKFKGLWVDMILWRTMCTCDHCKKRFKEETGYDIPNTIDWDAPEWNAYIRKREEWIGEFYDAIIAKVKSYDQEHTVLCNCSYFENRWLGQNLEYYRKSEFVGGDFSQDKETHSFECKLFNSVTANKPFEFLGSVMDPSLGEHVILKSEEKMKLLMFSCLMNNGRYGFIDGIDPCGTTNPKVIERMKLLAKEERPYEEYLVPEVEFCSNIGLYVSPDCCVDMRDNKRELYELRDACPHSEAVRGAASILTKKHIPFTVITKYDIDDLSKFDTIILSETITLDDEEKAKIREFAEKGGGIYASGYVALYDADGNKNAKGALADLLGVEFVGRTEEEVTYMRPENGGIVTGDFTHEHPLSFNHSQTLVKALGEREVLARLTLPYTKPQDETKFASAIANPPGIHTDYPSVVYGKFGKGKVVYSAACIEAETNYEREDAFIRALSYVLPEKCYFESDAPGCVEITLYKQAERKRYVLNMLNFQKELPPVPVVETTVKVRVEENVKRIFSAPDKTELPFTIENGEITINVDKLDLFKMIILEY